MDEILVELQKEYPNIFEIATIDAEGIPEASLENGVTAVPSIVAFKVRNLLPQYTIFSRIVLSKLFIKYIGMTRCKIFIGKYNFGQVGPEWPILRKTPKFSRIYYR